MKSVVIVAILATANLLAVSRSRADGMPISSIHSLLQDGQDVHVTYTTPYPTSLGNDLARRQADFDEYVYLLDGHAFDLEEAIDSHAVCWWVGDCASTDTDTDTDTDWDTDSTSDTDADTDSDIDTSSDSDTGEELTFCEQYPECCGDCDGDTILECEDGYCQTYYQFLVVDECVPPATWGYNAHPGDALHSYLHWITVTDTGDPCLETEDAGSDTDTGEDTDTSACEGGVDTDIDADTDTDTGGDTDADTDTGGDTDTDVDTDVDADTDFAPDMDAGMDSGTGASFRAGVGGCSCGTIGGGGNGLLELLMHVVG